MDLNTIIHSENAANIQLVINAKDFRDCMESWMSHVMTAIREHDEPSYYTREELAEKLHVSLVTLQRWRTAGSLPEPVTIDGRVLYDKKEVRDALRSKYKTIRKLNQKGIIL